MTRLLDLPLDLIDMIFRQHLSRGSLAALCRVSSSLHRLATPYLYDTVELVYNQSGQPPAGLQMSLKSDTNGLQYIRNLICRGSWWYDRDFVLKVLSKIGRDTLRTIEWDMSRIPSVEVLNVLRDRQKYIRKFTWIQSCSTRCYFPGLYTPNYLPPLGRSGAYSSVKIFGFKSVKHIDALRSWLVMFPGLRKLRLAVDHHRFRYNLAKCLSRNPKWEFWNHLGIAAWRDNLTTLKLGHVDVTLLNGLLKVDDLHSLTLYDCTGLLHFFGGWRKVPKKEINLKKLSIFINQPLNQALSRCVDQFIGSFEGLRELFLCSSAHDVYPLTQVLNHKRTLECLVLDILVRSDLIAANRLTSGRRCMTIKEMTTMANHLKEYPRLRELGLAVDVSGRQFIYIARLARHVQVFQIQKRGRQVAVPQRIARDVYRNTTGRHPKLRIISQVSGNGRAAWVTLYLVEFNASGQPTIRDISQKELGELEGKVKIVRESWL
ncbi:hypothetical protein BDD12DRAFT_875946 [Trichophaea hybrida]|nr:hypothetical protein BDD12DRAFT_875946 [Trichophaea hybrida]